MTIQEIQQHINPMGLTLKEQVRLAGDEKQLYMVCKTKTGAVMCRNLDIDTVKDLLLFESLA